MTDLVQGMKDATKSTRSRDKFGLDETLAIMAMFRTKLKPKQVSELTGRSVHSLRYKFLEGEIELNGEKVIRSVKRFKTTAEIYVHFGVEVPANLDADVTNRINAYKATRSAQAV